MIQDILEEVPHHNITDIILQKGVNEKTRLGDFFAGKNKASFVIDDSYQYTLQSDRS